MTRNTVGFDVHNFNFDATVLLIFFFNNAFCGSDNLTT